MEIMEQKEANFRLHTQEVRGSSPCAPTIRFSYLAALPNRRVTRIVTSAERVWRIDYGFERRSTRTMDLESY